MKILNFHTEIMRFSLVSAVLATLISCSSEQLPNVTIETEKGNIIIELYPEAAPATVANFARLIEDGFYDGVIFHRYVPGFVIQGGDPKGTGKGGPGWTIRGEFQDPELHDKMPPHDKGVIAMARTQNPDSAGSQFYICLTSDPSRVGHLNGNYTTFGKVIEGMEVVESLRERDVMKKVTIQHWTPAE